MKHCQTFRPTRVAITGGSGFIGTNLVELYATRGCHVTNLDIAKPRNPSHAAYWRDIDILDRKALQAFFREARPELVIHLAARTDLNEARGLEHYRANTAGVENVIGAVQDTASVRRVIFASSMLVNRVGYQPRHDHDYNPGTFYGQSKVIGEKLVLENARRLPAFCIIRPTSIWGEWFAAPYRDFFDRVLGGRFYHPGTRACTKTCGYVQNSVYQIDRIANGDPDAIHQKIFYIGDYEPVNISCWADEIAAGAGVKAPVALPFPAFRMAAACGDLLSALEINFPMTNFRLKNMTTNHVLSLENTRNIAGELPFSRASGIARTLAWMQATKPEDCLAG